MKRRYRKFPPGTILVDPEDTSRYPRFMLMLGEGRYISYDRDGVMIMLSSAMTDASEWHVRWTAIPPLGWSISEEKLTGSMKNFVVEKG
jgi:hypothetical protein